MHFTRTTLACLCLSLEEPAALSTSSVSSLRQSQSCVSSHAPFSKHFIGRVCDPMLAGAEGLSYAFIWDHHHNSGDLHEHVSMGNVLRSTSLSGVPLRSPDNEPRLAMTGLGKVSATIMVLSGKVLLEMMHF
jgi:hypothetical protein